MSKIQIRFVVESKDKCGGMIWHLAVHLDYNDKEFAWHLLKKVETIALEKGLAYLEAWTGDDPWVLNWYTRNGFIPIHSYLHVFLRGSQEIINLTSNLPGFQPVQAWAHYTGEDEEMIRSAFQRVHRCTGFIKKVIENDSFY